ncbi:MAG: response regulator transcription factor [Azoarcus sp.]|jgi:DNA-binding response OmpR family regulator|nr:response regulator transcription factor [Azoarcus sp.]MDD2873264.1 response regulator transcription factor [Azoarcus sp.]MDX9839178.1 response regulator transcription factor [Azoarcus sp.]
MRDTGDTIEQLEPGAGLGLRVCVVDDDDDLRDEIVLGLEESGFGVRGFPGSRELYRGLLHAPCDVVILDIGLPGEDGFSITTSLKEICKVGIVLLTSRTSIESRVKGLMDGADAYLTKPIDLRELAATVLSVHRRIAFQNREPGEVTGAGAPAPQPAATTWSLSVDGWRLMAPNDRSVSLTGSERLFLTCLFSHLNEVVRRDVLVEAMGHRADYYLSHRLDMMISRLRKKVLGETGLALPLRAVRGTGFSLICLR